MEVWDRQHEGMVADSAEDATKNPKRIARRPCLVILRAWNHSPQPNVMPSNGAFHALSGLATGRRQSRWLLWEAGGQSCTYPPGSCATSAATTGFQSERSPRDLRLVPRCPQAFGGRLQDSCGSDD